MNCRCECFLALANIRLALPFGDVQWQAPCSDSARFYKCFSSLLASAEIATIDLQGAAVIFISATQAVEYIQAAEASRQQVPEQDNPQQPAGSSQVEAEPEQDSPQQYAGSSQVEAEPEQDRPQQPAGSSQVEAEPEQDSPQQPAGSSKVDAEPEQNSPQEPASSSQMEAKPEQNSPQEPASSSQVEAEPEQVSLCSEPVCLPRWRLAVCAGKGPGTATRSPHCSGVCSYSSLCWPSQACSGLLAWLVAACLLREPDCIACADVGQTCLWPIVCLYSSTPSVKFPSLQVAPVNPRCLALEDRLSLLTTRQLGSNQTTRLLHPKELKNMLDTPLPAVVEPQKVWQIEDIEVEALTARWMAWYYGMTDLGPNAEMSNSQLRQLLLRVHPDKVSIWCLPFIGQVT